MERQNTRDQGDRPGPLAEQRELIHAVAQVREKEHVARRAEPPLGGDAAFASQVERFVAEYGIAAPQAGVLQATLAGNRMGSILRRATEAVVEKHVVRGSDPQATWAEQLRRWFTEPNA